jgi:hypothetical protein
LDIRLAQSCHRLQDARGSVKGPSLEVRDGPIVLYSLEQAGRYHGVQFNSPGQPEAGALPGK